ncbi:MAG: hypothetical protein QOE65_154 [Solirubrobacteraceae bacterium]|jgi:hypothetical protein|nr:hypothetical protein [Solirubrobacteraceae bacterium]
MPTRSLPTNDARNQFYKLVNKLSRVRKASPSLLDRAVEVGPRGQGGVVILPKLDAEAALARIAELEDELEDFTLAGLVEARLHTPAEDLLSVEALADSVGLGDVLSDRR